MFLNEGFNLGYLRPEFGAIGVLGVPKFCGDILVDLDVAYHVLDLEIKKEQLSHFAAY